MALDRKIVRDGIFEKETCRAKTMPIYEYLCEDCGERFEQLVRHPAIDRVACPRCGKDRLNQQISSFLAPMPGKFKPAPLPILNIRTGCWANTTIESPSPVNDPAWISRWSHPPGSNRRPADYESATDVLSVT